ncbi:MAG: energy-coupling factor transporter transmembrane protein EcfT [Chloroflexi bacterium]|nr:energy-coupling factor transporter transmembrane protein EcfT [Chloroflexota bacterium]
MRQFVWHEADSPLHRLNPLTKLALALPMAAVVTLFNEPLTPLLLGVVAALTTRTLGRVPWPNILRPLALALLLGFGLFWSSVVFYAGPGADGPSLVPGPVSIAPASLLFGLTVVCRLLAIFATSMLFVLTTNPIDLVAALIQQARLPVRVGYAVFAAYRFVPLVHEELENIQAAHHVRGGAGGRGPLARLRRMFGFAIPLLAISVRRAERVALAMDARGFGGHRHRTYYRQTHWTSADLWFLLGAALTCTVTILAVRQLAA